MSGSDEAPHYVAGRIERALAEDPRTNELGIHADVRGEVVYVRGEVAGERRRQLISEVVQAAAPGLTVRNEVAVADIRPPGQEETLS
ncbi:MAG: BON domain-containing protein [Actinobacteria bacterium]|nr:BON domain-containing protein [Actinomycetota bacterium]